MAIRIKLSLKFALATIHYNESELHSFHHVRWICFIVTNSRLRLQALAAMSFKDKYPKKCPEICPRCKKGCMHGMQEHHADADGNPTAHVCGPHWWIKVTVFGDVLIRTEGNVK
jgi:hypothetical protein